MVRAAAWVASNTDVLQPERDSRRRRLTAALLVTTSLVLAWLLGVPGAATGQGSTVLVTRVDGTITPVIADHLVDGVAAAERDGHAAYLVELDTPGGLDTSMREIIKAFLGADAPVVVYVTPSGARAASAGALITFAANLAAMAPGTTIGAATPVDLQGGEISDKVLNDAAAFAETVAAQRDRNTEFAVDTVREGRAVTAEEAVRLDAVDLLAAGRTELLEELDGRSVKVASGNTVTLDTAGGATVEQDFGLFRRLLQLLADPNLAFLFLSLGTLAIIYELANPGVGFGGIAGAIFLLLGFFALSVLPINLVGVLLLHLSLGGRPPRRRPREHDRRDRPGRGGRPDHPPPGPPRPAPRDRGRPRAGLDVLPRHPVRHPVDRLTRPRVRSRAGRGACGRSPACCGPRAPPGPPAPRRSRSGTAAPPRGPRRSARGAPTTAP